MDHILFLDVVHSLGPAFAILCITKSAAKTVAICMKRTLHSLSCFFRLTIVVASEHDQR